MTPLEWALIASVLGLLAVRVVANRHRAELCTRDLVAALQDPYRREQLLPGLRRYFHDDTAPGSHRPGLALTMAALELQCRQPVHALAALDHFDIARCTRSEKARWLIYRATAYFLLGDYARAEALAADVHFEMDMAPTTPLGAEALAVRAQALLNLGLDGAVVRLLEDVPLERIDAEVEAVLKLTLARALGRMGRQSERVDALLRAVLKRDRGRVRRLVREWPHEPAARMAHRLLQEQGPYR